MNRIRDQASALANPITGPDRPAMNDSKGKFGPAADEPQVTAVHHQPLGFQGPPQNPNESGSFNNRVADSLTDNQRQAYE